MPRTFYDADTGKLYGHRGQDITLPIRARKQIARAETWLRIFRGYRAGGMAADEARLRADCETPA